MYKCTYVGYMYACVSLNVVITYSLGVSTVHLHVHVLYIVFVGI